MNIDYLRRKIEESSISEHMDFILNSIRPAIDIIKNPDLNPYLGCSKFAGNPDLPIGSVWPMYNSVPYFFVGQINFSDIRINGLGLPESGLLSIFVADLLIPNGQIGYRDDMYVHTIFTPEINNLEPLQVPYKNSVQSMVISFHETIDIPYDDCQINDWPFTYDDLDVYEEIRNSLHQSKHYLLGYPTHLTLGYNPTPSSDWIPFLTLLTDRDFNWTWHDDNYLMIFIQKTALNEINFSALKADAG